MADLQGRKIFRVFNQDFIVDERYTVTKELGQGAYGIVWYVNAQTQRREFIPPVLDAMRVHSLNLSIPVLPLLIITNRPIAPLSCDLHERTHGCMLTTLLNQPALRSTTRRTRVSPSRRSQMSSVKRSWPSAPCARSSCCSTSEAIAT